MTIVRHAMLRMTYHWGYRLGPVASTASRAAAYLARDRDHQMFAVNVPLPGVAVDGVMLCPIDSKPLYRVYNNASTSNGRFVSNHRYQTEKADVTAVVVQGWVDEGQVMCVPL